VLAALIAMMVRRDLTIISMTFAKSVQDTHSLEVRYRRGSYAVT